MLVKQPLTERTSLNSLRYVCQATFGRAHFTQRQLVVLSSNIWPNALYSTAISTFVKQPLAERTSVNSNGTFIKQQLAECTLLNSKRSLRRATFGRMHFAQQQSVRLSSNICLNALHSTAFSAFVKQPSAERTSLNSNQYVCQATFGWTHLTQQQLVRLSSNF
jgi:hypothetical protein